MTAWRRQLADLRRERRRNQRRGVTVITDRRVSAARPAPAGYWTRRLRVDRRLARRVRLAITRPVPA